MMKLPRSIVHGPARAAFAAAWRSAARSARLRAAPWLGAIALLLAMSLLSACAPMTPPTETALAAIAQENKVIALFRLEVRTLDGRSLKPLDTRAFEWRLGDLETCAFELRLGDLETGGKADICPRLRYLSQELREAGWVYLILNPGRQYLYINFRRRHVMWASAPRWIVDIPSDARVVYLGTVKMQATMFEGWFSGPDDVESVAVNMDVANEESVARAIVAQHLASVGPVKTALMRVHATNTFEF